MAESTISTYMASSPGNPPMAFLVAVLLGFPHDQILRGLREGWIERPAGAPSDWAPDWGDSDGTGDAGNDPQSPPAPGDGGVSPIVDAAHVRHWMKGLDPSLTSSAFDRLWASAGKSDDARASALFGFLRRVLLGENSATAGATVVSAADGADPVAALDAFVADPAHRARVVDLAGKDGAEIAELARNDIGCRYALANLDKIAIAGNRALFAAHNADGALDRFDPETGDANVTDGWIADRAKFLAWKMRADDGGDLTIAGSANWTFEDRTLRDASGNPMKLEIKAAGGATLTHQVLFGGSGDESLRGGAGTDRIYGADGDDVIRGKGGGDHLEGGRGDDLLLGGAGTDELAGGQGADELDGGVGNDRLQGNSGDDTLTGGRGDDWLDGGAGHDVYVVDPGDGADTIIDADGDGEVRFDGLALEGASRKSGGKYVNADGRVAYSFTGDAAEGGTLKIELLGVPGSGSNAGPTSSVTIRNWKNGDLGISLGDGSAAALAADDASAPEDAGSATDENAVDDVSASADGAALDTSAASEDRADIPVDYTVRTPADVPDLAYVPGMATNENALDPTASLAVDTEGIALTAPAGATPSASAGTLEAPDIGAALVHPEAVDQAVRAFAGVPEAPDVTEALNAAPVATVGVTSQDLADAMLDFHDASDLGHDLAGSEPLPPPLPALTPPEHTASIVGAGATGSVDPARVGGVGRRAT